MILVEKGGTGMSRGCAFVNYSTHEAATAAIAALDNQVILPGGPYNLRVGGEQLACTLATSMPRFHRA